MLPREAVVIDLHSHTTASDGELSPTELVAHAVEHGVHTLAITDHDTVAGIPEALGAAASHAGFRLIPGIEITAHLDGCRELHLLGHLVDPEAPPLRAHAEHQRTERTERMHRMIGALEAVGCRIRFEQVEEEAAGGQLGRPHLARALLKAGYVRSMQEAFARYLGDGRPGHVKREVLSPEAAIALIHGAGGTATLAHPGSSRMHAHDIERLAGWGLDGIEAHHADHVPSQRDHFLRLAAKHDLIATGGSDFHGPTTTPHRRPGSACTPPSSFEALEARRSGRGTQVSPVISTG